MPTTIDGGTGASQIQDGTVIAAKIAAGAVTETKIADGAVTAAKLAVGAISTTSVLAATAGASAGAVGTYGWLYITATNTTITLGSTRAGSGLVWTGLYTNPSSGAPWTLGGSGSPAGTWRCMGHISAYDNANGRGTSLWLRIS
jgi:hypothetical protein